MSRKSSFSKKDVLEIAKGQFRDKSIGKLPLPPMLMIDRIIEISEVGGDYEKGYIKAEMDIYDNNWFFECHFKNDPVMPGCLWFRWILAADWIFFILGRGKRQGKSSWGKRFEV
jgi:3-hydroxymyristoyl/3-hydroxydecanoyl-(acyl carrier protein) dehydratases